MSDAEDNCRLDRATSARLQRLAESPVKVSGLRHRLEEAMHVGAADQPPALGLFWQRWTRPLASAAAVIALLVSVGWFVVGGGSPQAAAMPVALAQIHYEVANGLAPHLRVSNVEEANRVLAEQASGAVPLPDLPGELQSCCLHQLAGATLSCALIERGEQLITVAVAAGGMLHSPGGEAVVRDGRQFYVHTADGISMVMSHEGDRWLCVMGEVSVEELLTAATDIEL